MREGSIPGLSCWLIDASLLPADSLSSYVSCLHACLVARWCLTLWTVCAQISSFYKDISHTGIQYEFNPIGNQPWILIDRTDAETEAPILWPPDVKSRLIGKNPNAGKEWRQKEKGVAENEMTGWHHQFNGREPEQTLGDSEGQESLAHCSPWDCRVRHDWATEQHQQMTSFHFDYLCKDSVSNWSSFWGLENWVSMSFQGEPTI